MIRHIVFFSARDAADLPAIRDGLSVLCGIAHARRVEIALNDKLDSLSNEIDVVVYSEFDDLESLAAFKADPLYAESTRRVRPLRELRFVADFDADMAITRPQS